MCLGKSQACLRFSEALTIFIDLKGLRVVANGPREVKNLPFQFYFYRLSEHSWITYFFVNRSDLKLCPPSK